MAWLLACRPGSWRDAGSRLAASLQHRHFPPQPCVSPLPASCTRSGGGPRWSRDKVQPWAPWAHVGEGGSGLAARPALPPPPAAALGRDKVPSCLGDTGPSSGAADVAQSPAQICWEQQGLTQAASNTRRCCPQTPRGDAGPWVGRRPHCRHDARPQTHPGKWCQQLWKQGRGCSCSPRPGKPFKASASKQPRAHGSRTCAAEGSLGIAPRTPGAWGGRPQTPSQQRSHGLGPLRGSGGNRRGGSAAGVVVGADPTAQPPPQDEPGMGFLAKGSQETQGRSG